MKVFLSWSGERSRAVAEAFREWLPRVIQSVEPFISSQDIQKGVRFGDVIARELEGTHVGIICLTKDNVQKPWLMFEAGALSKSIADSRVCPYLLDLDVAEVAPPLGFFQLTRFNRDDTQRLLVTINYAIPGGAIRDAILSDTFDRWWPTLEERLNRIPPTSDTTPAVTRTAEDMLSEILRSIRVSNAPERTPKLAHDLTPEEAMAIAISMDMPIQAERIHNALTRLKTLRDSEADEDAIRFAEGALKHALFDLQRRLKPQ